LSSVPTSLNSSDDPSSEFSESLDSVETLKKVSKTEVIRKNLHDGLVNEYVILPEDSNLSKINKSVLRQSNLYKMIAKNNVCIVSDPYLLALDGLPKFEIL
jgi:hypothetical protein